MRVKKIIVALCLSYCGTMFFGGGLLLLTGCDEASRVRENLAQESDDFNVYRSVTVVNYITGDTLLQMQGFCSIVADTMDNQLEIITEIGDNQYSKQIVGLSSNVTYAVEDLNATNVSKYHYEINFNPNLWLPAEATIID